MEQILVFYHPTQKQIKHIRKAEEELEKAGVTFDREWAVEGDTIVRYEWQLGLNLRGAELKERSRVEGRVRHFYA